MSKSMDAKISTPAILILSALFLIFSAISISGFTVEFSDQNIYIYMGKLVSQGKLPYRDFFFAHPPGEIYIDALVYSIFGFNILAFKSISLLAVLATAYIIFLIARGYLSDVRTTLASALFLLTYETLRISAGNIGMAITVLLAMSALYCNIRGKLILAGALIGLASLFTFHAIPIAGAMMLYNLVAIEGTKLKLRPKEFMRISLGFLAIFGVVTFIFVLLTGNQYYVQVVEFNLIKPELQGKGIGFGLLKFMAKYNFAIFAMALTWLAAKNKKKHAVLAVPALLYIVYLMALSRVFPYYYFGLFPLVAVLGAIGFFAIISKIEPDKQKYIVLAIIALLAFSTWFASSNYYFASNNTFSGNEPQELSRLMKPDYNIFGDYLFVPLLALQKDIGIALDLVDTNPVRFEVGSINANDLAGNLQSENKLYIVIRQSNNFMSSHRETASYLNSNCRIVKRMDFQIPSYFDRLMVKDVVFLLECQKAKP